MIKILLIILLVAIGLSLAASLYFLVKDDNAQQRRVAKGLAWRVALSALLLGCVIIWQLVRRYL